MFEKFLKLGIVGRFDIGNKVGGNLSGYSIPTFHLKVAHRAMQLLYYFIDNLIKVCLCGCRIKPIQLSILSKS